MRAWPIVAVLLLAQPAAADLTLSNAALSPAVLAANGTPSTLLIDADYVCGAGQTRATARTMSVAFDVPRELGITGPASVEIPATACAGPASQPWHQRLAYNVSAGPLAVGLAGYAFTARATLPSDTTAPDETAPITVQSSVAARHGFALSVANVTRQAGPDHSIEFAVDVTNTGNMRTMVIFSLAKPAPSGWQVVVPEPVILEPAWIGRANATTHVLVVTPGHNGYNEAGAMIEVVATPSSAKDPTVVGTPVHFNLNPQVAGWYAPGPSGALLLLSVAIAAAFVRRVSRERFH